MKRLLVCLTAVVAAGCTRVTTLTTLHADGSFHEKTAFKVTSSPFTAGMSAGAPSDPFASAFKIDRAGAKVARSRESSADVLTVERDIAAGAPPYTDVQLLSNKGKLILTSQVQTTKLPNGDVEYNASLKYVGPPDPSVFEVDPGFRPAVKTALPPRYQSSTKVIDGFTTDLESSVLKTLFGPPYPELFNVMAAPDAMELRLGGTLKAAADSSAQKTMPDLTDSERSDCVTKVLKALHLSDWMTKQQNSHTGGIGAGKGNDDVSMFASMLYEVAFDGSVVETNGLQDSVSGHVYWCFYAASTELGDLRLHLVVHPAP